MRLFNLIKTFTYVVMNNFYPCFLHSITRFRTYTSNVDCRKHLSRFILFLLILQIVHYKSLWDSNGRENNYDQLLYFYVISNLFVKYFSSYLREKDYVFTSILLTTYIRIYNVNKWRENTLFSRQWLEKSIYRNLSQHKT